MIREYRADNGKFYTFFSERIHTPDPECLKDKEPKSPDRFFEGKPCVKCGETQRYTTSSQCVACSKQRLKNYNERLRNGNKINNL
ncbi:hypothetical protein PRA02_004691 [Salmonella enterica]|nr:hypothetical protein [Salmonella enterica]